MLVSQDKILTILVILNLTSLYIIRKKNQIIKELESENNNNGPLEETFAEMLDGVKIKAFSSEGGGWISTTHFNAIFINLFYQLQLEPLDVLKNITHVGSNSGGSWFNLMLLGYKNTQGLENMSDDYSGDEIDGYHFPLQYLRERNKFNQADALLFYDKYWLNPIRRHIHLKDISFQNTKTDEFGNVIEGENENILSKLFDQLFEKLKDVNIMIDELYQIIIVDLLGLEDKLDVEKFSLIIDNFGKKDFIKNIIDIIKIIIVYVNELSLKCWQCNVQDVFLYPLSKTLKETKFGELILIQELMKQRLLQNDMTNDFTLTIMSTCLYDSFIRYGKPGSPLLLGGNRYPGFFSVIPTKDDEIIRYEWYNDIRLGYDNRVQESKKVVGGVMNQMYTYTNDEDRKNSRNLDSYKKIYNFGLGENFMKYKKDNAFNICKDTSWINVDYEPSVDSEYCHTVCENRSVFDAACCSSAALGISNSYDVLVNVPCGYLGGIFGMIEQKDDQVFKDNILGAISYDSEDDNEARFDLIKDVICTLTVGIASRLITSNLVLWNDAHNNLGEENNGGLSGKYWLKTIMENETTKGGKINNLFVLTKEDEFKQNCNSCENLSEKLFDCQDGWNGNVAPSVFKNWKNDDDIKLYNNSKKRFIHAVADGAPTVNDAGFMTLLKSLINEDGRIDVGENENLELLYLLDGSYVDNVSKDDGDYESLGDDLLSCFGITINESNYITYGNDEDGNGIYKKKNFEGIELSESSALYTQSPWIFEKNRSLETNKSRIENLGNKIKVARF